MKTDPDTRVTLMTAIKNEQRKCVVREGLVEPSVIAVAYLVEELGYKYSGDAENVKVSMPIEVSKGYFRDDAIEEMINEVDGHLKSYDVDNISRLVLSDNGDSISVTVEYEG
jgi:hypothetical protein